MARETAASTWGGWAHHSAGHFVGHHAAFAGYVHARGATHGRIFRHRRRHGEHDACGILLLLCAGHARVWPDERQIRTPSRAAAGHRAVRRGVGGVRGGYEHRIPDCRTHRRGAGRRLHQRRVHCRGQGFVRGEAARTHPLYHPGAVRGGSRRRARHWSRRVGDCRLAHDVLDSRCGGRAVPGAGVSLPGNARRERPLHRRPRANHRAACCGGQKSRIYGIPPDNEPV